MAIENYEIIGSYNKQRFPNIDAERTINMFEYIDPLGKKPKALISTSGILDIGLEFMGASLTDGFRGEFVLNDFEYLVIGPNIYRRDLNNTIIKLNSTPLPTNTGYVGIDANNQPNGQQILFVDGIIGCIWDTGSNSFSYDIRTSIDFNFPFAPIDTCFIDGFLLVANAGNQNLQIATNTFQLSAFNNAYSWGGVNVVFTALASTDILTLATANDFPTGMPIEFTTTGTLPAPLMVDTTYFSIFIDSTHIKVATSFSNAISNINIDLTTDGTPVNTVTNDGQLQQAQIDSHPGPIVACRTLHRKIFLFSTNYTEVWENQGYGAGTNLPFRRNNALLIEYGTPAIGSIVTGFDKMFFLSNDKDGLGAVMEVVGTEAIPVSNRALDFQLSQYAQAGQIEDARGIFIKENGIIFYRLNFTEANHTFVYNVTFSNPTAEEGKLWHEEQILNGDRHPAQTHGYFNGSNYYGDYNRPVLYQVDQAFVTNDGETIPRIRIGRSYVPATYNRIRCDRFMLDVIQGLAEFTNAAELLDLYTEISVPILTENQINIILQESGMVLHNPDDHVIYLSISKDGGVTFNYREAAIVGKVGYRKKRTVWRKLGVIPRGQGFVPKIEFYGRIPFIMLGAAWSYEMMPE